MRSVRFFICFIMLGYQTVHCQYFGEQVLEKSFEQNDFFFKSVYVNPYGIGGFGSSAPGLIDNALLNIQINPAYIVIDPSLDNYVYFNFRNSKEMNSDDQYYPLYDMNYGGRALDYYYYPQYYANTRKELEPVITGVWFFRPARSQTLTLGFTYQAIFQDEGYYDIPQDIYRSNLGQDFAGNDVGGLSEQNITERYRGKDDMHQDGHFISFLTGYYLSSRIHTAIRINKVFYNREGGMGSTIQWDNGLFPDHESRNQYLIERQQDYDHWDISGGLNCQISPRFVGGISAGYLWGQTIQNLGRSSSSIYRNGIIDQGTDWHYYMQNGTTGQSWNHSGHVLYGGFNLKATINKSQTLNIFYRIMAENVNISLESAIFDTSYSNVHHESSQWQYGSRSNSRVTDDRTGTGTKKSRIHFFSATVQWQADLRTRLSFGFNLSISNRNTHTHEDVFADRFSDYWWSNSESSSSTYRSTTEEKVLAWDFHSKLVRIQIPVFLKYRLSRMFELEFGLNRAMTQYTITDETLALFDYRESTNTQLSPDPVRMENFGELYAEPKEVVSDITTSILIGMTMTPSNNFNIRLLTVPNYQKTGVGTTLKEFQWWIAFNLFM